MGFAQGDLQALVHARALFTERTFHDATAHALVDLAPSPGPRKALQREVLPAESRVSGVVFKIQANMDPAHRDRIAFMRVCSGRFERGMRLEVCRSLDNAEPFTRRASPYLVTAMVEQLSGRFTERADADGATLELVFPRTPSPQAVAPQHALDITQTTVH